MPFKTTSRFRPAFVPKPDALRRWRDFRGMTIPDLVAATKNQVKERTIRLLESAKPQPTANEVTIRALAKALTDEKRGIVCHPRFLAWWRGRDGQLEDADPKLIDPSLPSAPKKDTPAKKIEEEPEPTSAAEKRRALTRNAERERAIGRHRDTVKVRGVEYPLVGCDWLQEVEHQYAEHLEQTFAIAGAVADQRPIAAKAAAELKAEVGRGAAQFKIVRKASGVVDGEADSVPVYPSVFATRGEHGKKLSRCLKDKVPVTVLVHLVTTERRLDAATGDRWEGYFVFESGRPSPKPWAFVIDQVFAADDDGTDAAPSARKHGRTAPGGIALE